MPKHEIETLDITPFLDMEEYMILAQTKRIDHDSAVLIKEYWEKWAPNLRVRGITLESGDKVLAVWLTKVVEDEVNILWDSSPSQAFALNTMAQVMLMSIIRQLIPEVGVHACAPVPDPTPELKEALEDMGLPWEDNSTLSRQFAMITPYPFQGGCTICYLGDECPKANRDDFNFTRKEAPAPAKKKKKKKRS